MRHVASVRHGPREVQAACAACVVSASATHERTRRTGARTHCWSACAPPSAARAGRACWRQRQTRPARHRASASGSAAAGAGGGVSASAAHRTGRAQDGRTMPCLRAARGGEGVSLLLSAASLARLAPSSKSSARPGRARRRSEGVRGGAQDRPSNDCTVRCSLVPCGRSPRRDGGVSPSGAANLGVPRMRDCARRAAASVGDRACDARTAGAHLQVEGGHLALSLHKDGRALLQHVMLAQQLRGGRAALDLQRGRRVAAAAVSMTDVAAQQQQ